MRKDERCAESKGGSEKDKGQKGVDWWDNIDGCVCRASGLWKVRQKERMTVMGGCMYKCISKERE